MHWEFNAPRFTRPGGFTIGAAATWIAAWAGALAWAQQVPPPTVQPATAPPSAAAPSIVDSPQWQATRQAFHDWLSVQQIYSQQEIDKVVNDLRLRVAGMTEQERAAFLQEMQARLRVLNSEEARQARAWVGETMSRLTPAGQQRFRQQLPDVAHMSAGELEQSLASRQLQMQARQRSQAQAAQLRAQQNQLAMQMNQQRQLAFQDARLRQQSAVAGQATSRAQQGFQQSQQAFRAQNMRDATAPDPLFGPYIWANPWIW